MICASGALCAVLMSFSAPQPQPDHRIVVVASSPAEIRAKLVDAADKVCTQARANDPFGDFGSQEECIENTITHARHHVAYVSAMQASNSR
jgi:hypothetical protein